MRYLHRVNGPQPSIKDIAQMWRELGLTPQTSKHIDVEHLLSFLRETHSNGGAVFAAFQYESHPVFEWFIRTRRLIPPSFDFASEFMAQQVVIDALPSLHISTGTKMSLEVQVTDVFDLGARLLRTLMHGGAYSNFNGTLQQARSMVDAFTDAVAGHWSQQWIGYTYLPWSPWFHDVAWDMT